MQRRISAVLAELKACSISRNLERGKQIHEAAVQLGDDSDTYLASALINMYAKCGRMVDASAVFENMPKRDVTTFNTLILGYADNGKAIVAIDLLSRMKSEGFMPNARTFVSALKACNDLEECRETGRQLHLLAARTGCDSDVFVECTLVVMYARCGSMGDARGVFERMQYRDAVTWNALILGYTENGEHVEALNLFSRMYSAGCTPDARSFLASLKACSNLAEVCGRGPALHVLLSCSGCDSNMFVKSSLVDMYAKSGSIRDAQAIFDSMELRTVVVWTALILGYADNGESENALLLFSRMQQESCSPDAGAFVAATKCCTYIAVAEKQELLPIVGQRGRALCVLVAMAGCDSNAYVKSGLVDMFAKGGNMEDAKRVFDRMQCHDIPSWNALILGYAENGEGDTGLNLLSRMEVEGCTADPVTFVAAAKACNDVAAREEQTGKLNAKECGSALHVLASRNGCDLGFCVQSSFMDMYAKCGNMVDARNLFDNMHLHDAIAWTSLILGYAENGEPDLALSLFTRMQSEDCAPDVMVFVAALKACAFLGSLEFGKTIYADICRYGFQNDPALATCLVEFYAKCGSLVEAKHLFDAHPRSEISTWNALLAGYSRQGDTKAVLDLFDLIQASGMQPDGGIFLCVLTACSHSGQVDKGRHYYELMSTKYGIPRVVEHYTCMIDLLGRANQLHDAMVLIRGMQLRQDSVVWMAVLAACRKWKNVELGTLAFESVLSLDDKNSAAYVLMANIYGSREMWTDQGRVQAARNKLRVWKTPGWSWWTDATGRVHRFLAGDKNHPQSREISEKWACMAVRMKEHGYVADLSSITRNISDAEKEDALCGHSEKLAIACALINTNPGETIRIIKNLRACDDCHAATAMVSKLEQRTILCRDASRFHVFMDGKCSCGDFW